MQKSQKIHDSERWQKYTMLKLWEFDLFLDQYRESYAVYNNGSRHIYPTRSSEIKRLFSSRCKNPNQIETSVVYIDGLAAQGGKRNALDNRIAKRGDAIWIDAASERGEAIKITMDGLEIIDKPPLMFRHFDHMEPLVIEPGCKKDFDEFVSLMNLSTEDDRILYSGYAASLFIPIIDHPILMPIGPQGSAKTTMSLMTKMLLDPSKVPLLAIPDDPDKLPRIFTTHCFPVFDNCNYLSQETSDMLCRACTGGGITTRKLYTDKEEVVFVFHSPIILNGISAPSMSPDLVDRSLIVNLDRILEQNRKEKAVIETKRDALLPKVRGYLMGVVSDALRNGPNEATSLPRLADFAKWADACTYAMGYDKGKFMILYTKLARDSALDAVLSDPVTATLIEYLGDSELISVSPSELLKELNAMAGANTKSESWPKDAAKLSDFISGKLKPGLSSMGWSITKLKSNGKRKLEFKKTKRDDGKEWWE
jgi:hypothetical protein